MEKTCGISYITTWQELIINYLEKKIQQTNIVQNPRTTPGFFIKNNKSQDFPEHFSNFRTFQDLCESCKSNWVMYCKRFLKKNCIFLRFLKNIVQCSSFICYTFSNSFLVDFQRFYLVWSISFQQQPTQHKISL